MQFHGDGYHSLKRAIDVTASIVFMLFFGPLMLLIPLAIKLQSRGPILYRQERIGKDGHPFWMLKFRTMRLNTSDEIHRKHVRSLIRLNSHPIELGQDSLKIQRDPRITVLGRWLRKLSLDELPQLFNVLGGEMSCVGPRPPLPYEYELYEERHKERLSALPGITGVWQVEARNRVPFEEMVQMDINYIKDMNLGLDLWTMLRTPIEMIRGSGGG